MRVNLTTWVCGHCGSHDVQERVWRHCNSGECDGIGEQDEEDCWCMDCQRACEIVDIDEYKTKTTEDV